MNRRLFGHMTFCCLLLGLVGAVAPFQSFSQPGFTPLDGGFTYQGRLVKSGSPVSGTVDLQASLWDVPGSGSPPSGGTQIGVTQTLTGVAVSNGLFTVAINRGWQFGTDALIGRKAYLQLAVRNPAGSGAYTTLAPRQELTPAPYALALAPGSSISNYQNSPANTFALSLYSVNGNGLESKTNAAAAAAVRGENRAKGDGVFGTTATDTTNTLAGVHGVNTAVGPGVLGVGGGFGVLGIAQQGIGVAGMSTDGDGVTGSSSNDPGVFGHSTNHDGVVGVSSKANHAGVHGISSSGDGLLGVSTDGHGVTGQSQSSTAIYGVSGSGKGVYGVSTSETGVYGQSTDNPGVAGSSTNGYGASGTSGKGVGVFGTSTDGDGVHGTSANAMGVYGNGKTYGVTGVSTDGTGARGLSTNGVGVFGISTKSSGVSGSSTDAEGVYGYSSKSVGVHGIVSGTGLAAILGDNQAAGFGIRGHAVTNGTGVRGESGSLSNINAYTSTVGVGVWGDSDSGHGVLGTTKAGTGVYGATTAGKQFCGVQGFNLSGPAVGAFTSVGTGVLSVSGFTADLFVGGTGSIANGAITVTKTFRVNNSGKVYANGGYATSGADVAEYVPASGATPQPGDVVEIDPDHDGRFRLAATPASPAVAGVISTTPGLTMNRPEAASAKPVTDPILALAGRVPVKVCAAGGAIRPGDLLVSSAIPGRAMRAPANPAPGTILGKALGRLERGQGVIDMLVMLR